MTRVVIAVVAATSLAGTPSLALAGQDALKELRLIKRGTAPAPECSRKTFCLSAPFGAPSETLILGSGDDLRDYVLHVILAAGGSADNVVVEQRFVNTLVLWDEGPRHYLGGWKEYRSPWMWLERGKDSRFDLLPTSHPEAKRFVAYRKPELYAAFLRSGGKRWANLLSLEYRPASAPKEKAYEGAQYSKPVVTTASILLRISTKARGRYKELFTIEIQNPEGHS